MSTQNMMELFCFARHIETKSNLFGAVDFIIIYSHSNGILKIETMNSINAAYKTKTRR